MFFAKCKPSIELFYERWKSIVFTFCLLITGNGMRAEESTIKGFTDYVRNSGDSSTSEFPPSLLRYALKATQESFVPVPMGFSLKVFEYAVFLLPIRERAAFVIRHVLGLPLNTASLALEVSPEEVKGLCFNAMMRLRKSLPAHFFERSK